jgi:two-component system NtrC family response regulator
MNNRGAILLIDNEEQHRLLLSGILRQEGYEVFEAVTAKRACQLLEQEKDIQLVITDVKLPDENGMQLLEKIRKTYPLTEVIVMTKYGTIYGGVQAMKIGAFDYIIKDDGEREVNQVIVTVDHAMEKAKMQGKIALLEKRLDERYGFDNILGLSPALRETIRLSKKVAPTDSTVLLEGETGVGKELFAHAIHYASNRKHKPFVAINCSAFARDLLESEMFGYKKGAFTGATEDKKGLFEAAHGGTLFLDEIGEMNPDLQAKLLRALETQTFNRVGDTKPVKVDVRIIAATNRNLKQESEEEDFRFDLYYRLSVFKIEIPPLRERREDIMLFANHFLNIYSIKSKKRLQGMDEEFMKKLNSYEWKGNIRELKNIMERAVILAEGPVLTVDLLPQEMRSWEPSGRGSKEVFSLDRLEKEHIQKVLSLVNGNRSKAAEILDIGIATLYRKLNEYQLD